MTRAPVRDFLVGCFVLIGLGAIAYLSLEIGGLASGPPGGFTLFAVFDEIGGLKPRAPVVVSGVKVGQVKAITLDKNYRARIELDLTPGIALPVDTTASIVTAGVLGDRYIQLQLGGDPQILKAGEDLGFTESAVILERLIGKFVHNVGVDKGEKTGRKSNMLAEGGMMMRTTRLAIVLLALLCAGPARAADGTENDPWEGFNRAMFTFNDGLDRWVLEPVAKGYDVVVPDPLERCISNFFQNLRVPINTVNDFLQWKPVNGASDIGRFTVNTTLGLAGFLDPATYFGLVRHDEDFGQTLGVWGVPQGPYLVVPLLGPSTVRDTGGLVVDSALTPTWYFLDTAVTVGARVVDSVNTRALVLEDIEHARSASFDFYGFVRNAYLQRRASMLRDDEGSTRETDDSLYYLDEPAK